jgi:UDP-GlcNAc:undecaprenyl-phosphate GlcNAc-1-phosphate transferase
MLVFATGFLDDLRNLKPLQKLTGQAIGAVLFYWLGVLPLTEPGGLAFHLWALPATVFWIVLCTNAFNLIDGLDGLASGLALVACAIAVAAALLRGDLVTIFACAPLAGALLAFLVYNFSPASIFLGDCGSLVIGFLLGCFAVLWGLSCSTIMGACSPLIALSIPLLDTGLAVLRRFLRSQPIFKGDRGHIHHRLIERGMKPQIITLLLCAAATAAGTLSLAHQQLPESMAIIVLVIFFTGAIAGVRALGFIEIDVAAKLLMAGGFRRILDVHIGIRSFEESLAAASTMAECQAIIRKGARDYGLAYLRLSIYGQVWEERFREGSPDQEWSLHVPLAGSDCIVFVHNRAQASPNSFASFVEVLYRVLPSKADSHTDTKALAVTVGS